MIGLLDWGLNSHFDSFDIIYLGKRISIIVSDTFTAAQATFIVG